METRYVWQRLQAACCINASMVPARRPARQDGLTPKIVGAKKVPVILTTIVRHSVTAKCRELRSPVARSNDGIHLRLLGPSGLGKKLPPSWTEIFVSRWGSSSTCPKGQGTFRWRLLLPLLQHFAPARPAAIADSYALSSLMPLPLIHLGASAVPGTPYADDCAPSALQLVAHPGKACVQVRLLDPAGCAVNAHILHEHARTARKGKGPSVDWGLLIK